MCEILLVGHLNRAPANAVTPKGENLKNRTSPLYGLAVLMFVIGAATVPTAAASLADGDGPAVVEAGARCWFLPEWC